jgi:AsmA protein
MVRSVLDMILAGWQASESEETRFRTFGASFTVENGVARSNNVRFNGPFIVMTATGAADLRTQTLDFRAEPKLVASAGTAGATPRGIGVPVVIQGRWSDPRIYADTPNILANPDGALRALRDALGIGRGAGSQSDAPVGKLIEGLSKGLGKSDGDQTRDGGTIADEVLKALGGGRGSDQPQSEPATPDSGAGRSGSVPERDQDIGRRAREFLQDLLGR